MDSNDKNEIIIYQTQDGKTKIDVNVDHETVWLSQKQMAELFQTIKQNISLHIKNVFEEGELEERSTVKNYLTVQKEGSREISREIAHYNLEVIIAVGYRVRSHRGTQFRQWATQKRKKMNRVPFNLKNKNLKDIRTRAKKAVNQTLFLLKNSIRICYDFMIPYSIPKSVAFSDFLIYRKIVFARSAAMRQSQSLEKKSEFQFGLGI